MVRFKDKRRAVANVKKNVREKMGNFSRVANRLSSIRGRFRFIEFFLHVIR